MFIDGYSYSTYNLYTLGITTKYYTHCFFSAALNARCPSGKNPADTYDTKVTKPRNATDHKTVLAISEKLDNDNACTLHFL